METLRYANVGRSGVKYTPGQGFKSTGRSPIPKYKSPNTKTNTVKSSKPDMQIASFSLGKDSKSFTRPRERKKKMMHVWNVEAHKNTIN